MQAVDQGFGYAGLQQVRDYLLSQGNEVNLAAGGHLHNGVCGATDRGAAYIQADATAKGYASATIVVGEDGSVRVEEPRYTSITEDTEALFDTPENAGRLDDTILDISHTAWSEIRDEMDEVLGYIETPIKKKGFVGDRETSGGNWITSLMLCKTEPEGVVAAFYNRKGIRANITIPEGETRHNLTAIELLREEADENEGRISVDTEPRGIRLEEVLDNAA